MRIVTGLFLTLAICATQAQAQSRAARIDPADLPKFSSLDAAIAAAKSDDPKQQIAAARWMAATKVDAAAAVPALIPLLDKPTLQREMQMHVVRENPGTAAVQAIYALGPGAIGPLSAAVDNPSPAIRTNVLHLLGRYGDDPIAAKALLACVNDAEASVRLSAVAGLARSNTVEATQALLATLADKDAGVRAAAASSIGSAAIQRSAGKPIPNALQGTVVAKLAELLKDPEKNVKINAAESLGRLRNGNATEALAAAVDDADIRVFAVQALGSIGNSRGTMAVIRVLRLPADAEKATARALAAQALGKLVDVRAVKPLIVALKDPDENVRQWAAESLGLIGDRRAVQPLIEVLKEKSVANQRVRTSAARSLGRIGDVTGVEPLVAALADKSTRHEAIRALGGLRDPAAIEPLTKLLLDETIGHQDQETCVWAISQIRDPRAIKALVEGAIQTKDTYVKRLARRTLDKLLDTSFAFDAEQPAKWWAEHKAEYDTE
jgi:HEAT repeat protein